MAKDSLPEFEPRTIGPTGDTRFMNEKETAEAVQLPFSVFRSLRRAKLIPHYRFGYHTILFSLPEVERALKNFRAADLGSLPVGTRRPKTKNPTSRN
jgi:hypothetical protein